MYNCLQVWTIDARDMYSCPQAPIEIICQGHIICTGDELKHTEHTKPIDVCWNLTVGWEEMADSWGFPWHWRNKGQDQGCSDGLVHSGPGIYY